MTATACLLAAVLVLSSANQVAATVVCVGLDGHIDFEFIFEGCCISAPPGAGGENAELAPAGSTCGDCTDVQLKAPLLRSKELQLCQPNLGAGCIVCSVCSSSGLTVRATTVADMDQHWHSLALLSTVVLLT